MRTYGMCLFLFQILGTGTHAAEINLDEVERIPNNGSIQFTQPPAFKFSDVLNLLNVTGVKSVPDLLSLLPESYRKHYTFLYKSHSLQPASPEFPRAIVYGGDARFIMTFEGNPALPQFHTIETAELDDASYEYKFRRILFDPSGAQKPKIDNSPSICASCHGSKPKPIWDAYPFWRGAYGSRSHNKLDRFSKGSLEESFYNSFLARQRDQGIYASFPKLSSPHPRLESQAQSRAKAATFTPNGAVNDPTAFLSEQFGEIMFRRAAIEIKASPNYARFRYPLAFAALCEDEIPPLRKINGKEEPNPDFIPPEKYLGSKEAQALPTYWESYLSLVTREHALREREAVFYNPQSKVMDTSGQFPLDESDTGNFGAIRYPHKAYWVYLLGLMGLDPGEWAMSFDYGALALEEGGPPAFLRIGALLFGDDPEIKTYVTDATRTWKWASSANCAKLAAISLKTMVENAATMTFAVPEHLLNPIAPLGMNNPLPSSVPKVVHKCLECHGFDRGAPVIPFDRPGELAFALRLARGEGMRLLIDEIQARVNSGDMPRRGSISEDEKKQLFDYINALHP